MKTTDRSLRIPQIFFGVVLTGMLIFRLRLLHLPLDRDEGEFAYAGWRMLQGAVPYLDFYNMKMPGIYAAYSFFFFVFGVSIEAIRWGLVIVILSNTFFVYKIASRWEGARNGYFASICYLVFSMQVELQATAAHAEYFAMLFVLPGILLFTRASERKSMAGFFVSGLLTGTAFLMKQPAVSFIMMSGLLLTLDALKFKPGWKYYMMSGASLALGAMLPLILTAALMMSAGAGGNFLLFTFSYAREYISYLTFNDGWNNLVAVLSKAVQPNLLLWLLVPAGLVIVGVTSRRNNYLIIFFLFSFIATAAGLYFRPHYFQFLLHSLAMLAASALTITESFLADKSRSSQSVRQLPAIFLTLAVLYFAFSERKVFSLKTEEDYIKKIYGQDFFNATKKAGEFIAGNSSTGDSVAIFGAEPEIWFYSRRVAASGYMYVYPLLENQKFAPSMRQQFYSEVSESHPEILVYTSNGGTWYASDVIHKEMFNWYKALRDSSYQRIALIDMPYDAETSYDWTGDTAIHPRNEENYIEICKRK